MPAKFVAIDGKLKGLVLSLEEAPEGQASPEWIIGRDPDQCQLVIEDSAVSRRHVLCRKGVEGFLLENLSATNPIQVNGQTIRDSCPLVAGDHIRIGSDLFAFILDESQVLLAVAEGEIPQHHHTQHEPTHIGAHDIHFDLTVAARWMLKVIAGPNSGAEFSLEANRTYVIGTDSTSCDIIFNDLSVSRQHAKLSMTPDEGHLFIEDLGSRNGVVLESKPVDGRTEVPANQIVSLGTTAFVLIDREGVQDTIIAPLFALPKREVEVADYVVSPDKEGTTPEEEASDQTPSVVLPASPAEASPPSVREPVVPMWKTGTFLFLLVVTCFFVVIGAFTMMLFHETEAPPPPPGIEEAVQKALNSFPEVKYSYNPFTRKLFLLGHVASYLQKQQLTYNLQGIASLGLIDDHIIVDEVIWQEMNILLDKNPSWVGVSMHSPTPGVFVITGYLETRKQAQALTDYLNLNFPYLDLLKNQVIVEEDLRNQVMLVLADGGFTSVTVALSNGELVLKGSVPNTMVEPFRQTLDKLQKLPGIRSIKNFVVFPPPEDSVVDISSRYVVSGYSQQDKVNVNVLINGKILVQGDVLDGMKITGISEGSIFLEKDNIRYRIQYKK